MFKSYLSYRKQRVVLSGVASDWTFRHAGVPQGSILRPLLFFLYISDIVVDKVLKIRLFADGTTLFIVVDDLVIAAACINTDLGRITQWAATWLVTFNSPKTKFILVSRKLSRNHLPPLFMQNVQIAEAHSHEHLGIIFSRDSS